MHTATFIEYALNNGLKGWNKLLSTKFIGWTFYLKWLRLSFVYSSGVTFASLALGHNSIHTARLRPNLSLFITAKRFPDYLIMNFHPMLLGKNSFWGLRFVIIASVIASLFFEHFKIYTTYLFLSTWVI